MGIALTANGIIAMYRVLSQFKAQHLMIAMLTASTTTLSHAENNQHELAELRQQIMDLRHELQQIKNQTSQPVTTLQTVPTTPITTAVSEKKSFISNHGAEVSLYGYIRTDASYQAKGAATMYNNISAVPLENTAEAAKQSDQLRATASATRIGVNFKTPTAFGDIGGKFETDFFGSATRDQFRIRHAYLTYDNWLVGQTWSNFIAPEYLPETIDAATYVGGSLQRTPIIRYSDKITDQTSFVVSIEDPKYTAATDPDHEMRLPAIVGRVNHKFDNGSILSGRSFLAEKKTSNDQEWAWGIGLGGKYQMTPDTMLKADYYHIKGDGRFLFWTNSGYVIDDQQQMHSNEFDTISLGLTHQLNPKLRSTLGYGYMRAKDDNTFASLKYNDATQNKALWQGWANAIYNPYKPISLGIEYVYGERETFDGRTGSDNRVNMMAIYDF